MLYQLKVVLSYSTVKGFHIYDTSILVSVHANFIDSIFSDLVGLVV